MRLHPKWKRLARGAWSFRLAAFWCSLNGIVSALDVFAGTTIATDHPYKFVLLNMVGYAVIGIARITKQPGLE